jgi:hypothetical protein
MGKPDTGWRCAADQPCAETGKLAVTNLVVEVVDEDTSPERPPPIGHAAPTSTTPAPPPPPLARCATKPRPPASVWRDRPERP